MQIVFTFTGPLRNAGPVEMSVPAGTTLASMCRLLADAAAGLPGLRAAVVPFCTYSGRAQTFRGSPPRYRYVLAGKSAWPISLPSASDPVAFTTIIAWPSGAWSRTVVPGCWEARTAS